MNDPCPCGGGKLVNQCQCLQPNGNFVPVDVETRLPGTVTGYAHPSCYASVYNNCSTKNSGEHYISKVILEDLRLDGGVRVTGMKWMKAGESRRLSVDALQANVLCTRHNSALTGLDQVGYEFFSRIKQIHSHFDCPERNKSRQIFLFNGHDIERWMLKLLCGVVSSTAEYASYHIPKLWLRVLYGDEYFRDGLGLYCVDPAGIPRTAMVGVSYDVLLETGSKKVLGVRVTINSISFFLAVESPQEYDYKNLHSAMDYRLGGLSFMGLGQRRNDDKDRHTIKLGWRLPHDPRGKNIVIGSSVEINMLFDKK